MKKLLLEIDKLLAYLQTNTEKTYEEMHGVPFLNAISNIREGLEFIHNPTSEHAPAYPTLEYIVLDEKYDDLQEKYDDLLERLRAYEQK